MRNYFKSLIRFYKRTLSPYMGGQCRFYPTCSSYALEALNAEDVLPLGQAMKKIVLRILSCHPFHPGGSDPVLTIERK